ncbi:hypothetical protein M8C21_014275 [Ambrosia artemisiifolia]|uniref:Uncharacterized protein n=1 Tax=Ambrosia artemisiifolia TaxID=4212 RepID=A0AAD5G894_AMBAR|nr:hypothetical protein M8C21_014275 [Ambrosia artemisiifolia]
MLIWYMLDIDMKDVITLDALHSRDKRFNAGNEHLLPPTPGSQAQHLRVEDRNRKTILELLEQQSEGNQGFCFGHTLGC